MDGIIGALILGLVAGFVGKLLLPGRDPSGFLVTMVLGLVGAALGFAIFTLLLGIGDEDVFDLGGIIGAIIGVMIVLYLYRRLVEPRTEPARAATGRGPGRRRR